MLIIKSYWQNYNRKMQCTGSVNQRLTLAVFLLFNDPVNTRRLNSVSHGFDWPFCTTIRVVRP